MQMQSCRQERLSSDWQSSLVISSPVVSSQFFQVINANELAYDSGALCTNFHHMGYVHLTSSGSLGSHLLFVV